VPRPVSYLSEVFDAMLVAGTAVLKAAEIVILFARYVFDRSRHISKHAPVRCPHQRWMRGASWTASTLSVARHQAESNIRF
jgi:hypothetical protein